MEENNDIQDKGHGDWNKLYKFMDENYFSNADFIACICANLCRQEGKKFETSLLVGGQVFKISFIKSDKKF